MSLLPQHLAKLEASAIAAEVAKERDYRSVTEKVVLERYSFSKPQRRVPTLLIPVHSVTGEIVLHQARPDTPRMDGKGKPVKYETPGGSRMALDVHPRARDRIGDPSVPLWITEGPLKGDALVSRGECAVALLGVWNWRGTNSDGGKTVLPDFESIAFNGRETYISFDSDVSVKPEVHKALERLKALLEQRGARVRVVYLEEIDGEKVGIDDYLAAGGDLEELRNAAEFTLRPPLQPELQSEEPVEEPEKRHEGPPPELAELLADLAAFVRRFVVINAHQALVIALWIVHTYALAAADTTPYIAITSPEKRSGKTRCLEVFELVVPKPLPTANISDAALFRAVASMTPVLLFDEVDAIFGPKARDREDLRGMLNCGFRRGARVYRMGGANMSELESFPVFAAKCFAGIGNLPDTIADRSISIRLERRTTEETIERFRRREVEPEANALSERVAHWADGRVDDLLLARPALPDELDDRAQDVWEPLLAIADLADGDWPERAREAAIVLSGARDAEDTSSGVQLLAHIRDLFSGERISCSTLVKALNEDEQLPYGGWSEGKGITTRELGRKLSPYGVKAKKIRLGEKTVNGYEHDQFTDAWSRYLPSDTVSTGTTGTTQSQSQKQAENEPEQKADVPVTNNGATPHEQSDVPVVPVSRPLTVAGDPMYPVVLAEAQKNGHITLTEARERYALQQAIERDSLRHSPPNIETGPYTELTADVVARAKRARAKKRKTGE